MNQLAPGVYDDHGTLHINAEELLEANGFAVTEENIERVANAGLEMAVEYGLTFKEEG